MQGTACGLGGSGTTASAGDGFLGGGFGVALVHGTDGGPSGPCANERGSRQARKWKG